MKYFEKTSAKKQKTDVGIRAVAGGAAFGIGTLITHPLDTLRVKKQTDPEGFKVLMKELRTLKPTAKVKRLMQGSGMKMGKSAIFGATMFGLNAAIENMLKK